jgi:methylamine dehydrogenase light chain
MNWLDKFSENSARTLARQSSRRSFVARIGTLVLGAAAVPLLPVARAGGASRPAAPVETGDPESCDYWRYCAIDGFLCDCCGGSYNSCPPGTIASPITWIGTCSNPVDGKDYIISYNDCCGKSSCGRCLCNRNEGDKPVYQPFQSNDINWCAGSAADVAYNCSTAVVLGLAVADT